MRQFQLRQRGSANWPFILSLLLLLVFVYLWFDQRTDVETAAKAQQEAETQRDEALQVAQDFVTYGRDLSELVGYDSKVAGEVVSPKVQTAANRLPGTQDFYFTDLDKLRVNLEPDGTREDGSPGALKVLIDRAQLEIQAEMRRAAADGVEAKEVTFEWMSPELRAAVAEINALEMPTPPVPPLDPDDEAAVSDYEAKLKAYEAARDRWEAVVDKAAKVEGWRKFKAIIKPAGQFDPDVMQVLRLEMFVQPPTGKVTVADILTFPGKIIDNYNAEFGANKAEDQAVISRLQADGAAKAAEIADMQEQLSQEQDRHNADVNQLRGELTQATEAAEQNRRDATTALNDLAREKEDKETVVTTRDTRIRALEERIRFDKETRDLEIRRDDPDGRILTSSPMMQTAVIDLGSSGKVYPGLKFRVSRVGRGGRRQVVGEVTVTRVSGPNAAKVSISGLVNPRNPIVRGDIISNPFYKATAPIYLYLAGELEKYPLEVALSRLARMNVVVDKEPSGRTDYIVVPNAMAAPAASGGDEEDMGDEESSPGGKTEFERMQGLARTLGAQVITERMLNEFLGL